VFASSLHVTGFYDASERISPELPVRPDSFYGAGKACGESLGRLYADKHGLQVVCVRIGTFAERPTTPRHLSTWLSPRDAVELFWRCLVAPDIGFIVVYGTSATRRGWWDPGPVERLGYRPADDAEAWAAEVNSADADPTESGKGPQGGSYAR
jgi:uronate dehydrogenase